MGKARKNHRWRKRTLGKAYLPAVEEGLAPVGTFGVALQKALDLGDVNEGAEQVDLVMWLAEVDRLDEGYQFASVIDHGTAAVAAVDGRCHSIASLQIGDDRESHILGRRGSAKNW